LYSITYIHASVAIGKAERHVRKASHSVAASNDRVHQMRSLSSSPLARTINCSPGSQSNVRGHSSRSLHRDHSNIAC